MSHLTLFYMSISEVMPYEFIQPRSSPVSGEPILPCWRVARVDVASAIV
jgi:hypothetical protein